MKKIVVIGGGAAGMAAALSASENRTNRVILLERQARVGRKLLTTGNGRCNLTNTGADLSHYHGKDTSFAGPALKSYSPELVMEKFRSMGLLCTELYGGRVYPLSDAAGSVLDVLRYSLDSSGVEVKTGERICRLKRKKDEFAIVTENEEYTADAVIVACGGKAGGKVGGVSDGYELLKLLGHSCTPLYPALVPIWTDTDFPRSLKGVRADASVYICRSGKTVCRSRGEVQFVERGVSGPAAFDVSREASVSGGDLVMDFLADYTEEDVLRMLRQRKMFSPEKETGSIFAGMLHSRLGMVLVRYCAFKPSEPISCRSEQDMVMLSHASKNFCLRITGTDSFDNAQITAGGILTEEFDPQTMESRLVPNVYACGEVLDIDGDCGGYNLHWAWASGFLAGRLGK